MRVIGVQEPEARPSIRGHAAAMAPAHPVRTRDGIHRATDARARRGIGDGVVPSADGRLEEVAGVSRS